MTYEARVSVPADRFPLGAALAPDVTVNPVRLVPIHDCELPLFWVEGTEAALAAFENSTTEDDRVQSITSLADGTGGRLYAVEAVRTHSAIREVIVESGVYLRRLVGADDEWKCHFLSPDHQSISAFGEGCVARSLPFTVERLSVLERPGRGRTNGLTPRQREALHAALEDGYFDIPRATTLAELGDRLGISRQAVSHRLRRGIRHLLSTSQLETSPTTVQSGRANDN